jgi:tetratricopeptide (TPR) repeat protein
MKRIKILIIALILPLSIFADSLRDMDRQAKKYFDEKDFNKAVALWLEILAVEPDNEKVKQNIELVYEIKQKKDMAFQKSKIGYRISRRKIAEDDDNEIEAGITSGKSALKSYLTAYRLDPDDSEVKDYVKAMQRLDAEIKAAQEKLRLSRELREKIKQMKINAQTLMAAAIPDYEGALNIWKDVLRYASRDEGALEGKRRCELAIENRLKYEKIKGFLASGKALFDKKQYRPSRSEFEQVLAIDQKNKEAKDYIERIDEIIEETQLGDQRRQQAEEFYQSGIRNTQGYNFDQAQEDLESCLALIKDYKDAKERLANLDRLRKEYKQREQVIRLERINKRFQDGVMSYAAGRYKDAVAAFVETISLDKNNKQAKEYLARAREAMREEEEEYVDENSQYFNVVNSLIMAGRALYNKGEFAESKKKWDAILRLFPKNKVAKEYLVRCDLRISPTEQQALVERQVNNARDYLKNKQYRNALAVLEIVQNVDKNYPGLVGLFAQAREGIKEAREGKAAVPADRADMDRRYQVGMQLYQVGGKDNIEKALNEFRFIVARDPGNVKAVILVNKIEAQLRLGRPEVDTAKRITPQQQEMANRLYYSGINYYSNNNFKKAVEEWRKVLAIDPDNVKAKNNIRKVLSLMGQ